MLYISTYTRYIHTVCLYIPIHTSCRVHTYQIHMYLPTWVHNSKPSHMYPCRSGADTERLLVRPPRCDPVPLWWESASGAVVTPPIATLPSSTSSSPPLLLFSSFSSPCLLYSSFLYLLLSHLLLPLFFLAFSRDSYMIALVLVTIDLRFVVDLFGMSLLPSS